MVCVKVDVEIKLKQNKTIKWQIVNFTVNVITSLHCYCCCTIQCDTYVWTLQVMHEIFFCFVAGILERYSVWIQTNECS